MGRHPLGHCVDLVDDAKSLAGAIKLYDCLGDELSKPGLSGAERKILREERRRLLEIFGPSVRGGRMFEEHHRAPLRRFVSVRKPPSAGAMVILFGEDREINRTLFTPARAIEDDDSRRTFERRPLAHREGPPGDLQAAVSPSKLAEALRAMAREIEKLEGVDIRRGSGRDVKPWESGRKRIFATRRKKKEEV